MTNVTQQLLISWGIYPLKSMFHILLHVFVHIFFTWTSYLLDAFGKQKKKNACHSFYFETRRGLRAFTPQTCRRFPHRSVKWKLSAEASLWTHTCRWLTFPAGLTGESESSYFQIPVGMRRRQDRCFQDAVFSVTRLTRSVNVIPFSVIKSCGVIVKTPCFHCRRTECEKCGGMPHYCNILPL